MMRRAPSKRLLMAALLLPAVLLTPTRAWAPPPITTFPSSVQPAFGHAPLNTRLWAFGTDAPPPAETGFTLVVQGATLALQLEALGCCAVVARPVATRTGSAAARVHGPAGEVRVLFAIDGQEDRSAPALTRADVLDDSGGLLVIGVLGEDDAGLAGFLARAGAEVRGAAPPGAVLQAVPGADGCVEVRAVDLAGNESAPLSACGARPDAGVGGDAGQAPAPESGCGCAATGGGTALWPIALALGLLRRRRAPPGR